MLLQLSTWLEIEAYLKESTGIILPIGSTEQHGPTGLIGTDAICAEAIARGVGEGTGALVGPTLNIGMALHHTAFPGTISLRPGTIILLIRDCLLSLAKAGFERFLFINGHGGNIATLSASFSETYASLADLNYPNADRVRCQVNNWWSLGPVHRLAKQFYGGKEGAHATPSEVALTQYVYPDFIKCAPLTAEVSSQYKIYGARDFRRRYPDGRMGSDPSLATPDHGKQLYELAVQELSQVYGDFLKAE